MSLVRISYVCESAGDSGESGDSGLQKKKKKKVGTNSYGTSDVGPAGRPPLSSI